MYRFLLCLHFRYDCVPAPPLLEIFLSRETEAPHDSMKLWDAAEAKVGAYHSLLI